MRFTSHRDFSRAFERAVFRARVPVAYSSGFNPHPRISYAGASPTGAASEAEYLEIALAEVVDPAAVQAQLDEVMPQGLDIVDEVARPEIRLLYDIYHAAVMGEEIEVLKGRLDRVVHVHLADTPGRGEPGSGRMDYADRLEWLEKQGYTGLIGLEYKPSGPTVETLRFRETVGA